MEGLRFVKGAVKTKKRGYGDAAARPPLLSAEVVG